MNSKAKGEISEGVILATLLKKGDVCLLPFGNNQPYDIVIDRNGTLLKGQCKTGRIRNGVVCFNTCSTNGFTGETKTYRGLVDLFWVYSPEDGKVYEIKPEEVGVKEGYLRIEATKDGAPQSKIRWAKEFEI